MAALVACVSLRGIIPEIMHRYLAHGHIIVFKPVDSSARKKTDTRLIIHNSGARIKARLPNARVIVTDFCVSVSGSALVLIHVHLRGGLLIVYLL